MNTPPLQLQHLQAYAETSKDFNPIHTDKVFASQSPHGDVIVHGMLSMGVLGQYAENVYPDYFVTSLGVRFQQVVQLGAVLTCASTITEQSDTALHLTLTATNEKGDIVTSGMAVLKKY